MEKAAFHFHTRQALTYLTGRRANNLSELLAGIKEAGGSCVYHHTHRFLEQHAFFSPEPPNDFAYWIKNVMQEEELAEQVASIDLWRLFRLKDIREKIAATIEAYVEREPACLQRRAPTGHEFHFMSAQTFVFPTPFVARDLTEFKACLERVTLFSIYYHMFESRLRLQKDETDFSNWLRNAMGDEELAARFSRMDPYTQTLENLRQTLIRLVEWRLKQTNRAQH